MHWGDGIFTTLKIVHVLFAAAFVGAAVYMNFVVAPLLRRVSVPTRSELMGALNAANHRYSNMMGGFTLLTGLLLGYAAYHGGLFAGATGRLLGAALIGNLAVLYLLNFATRPTIAAIGRLMKDLPAGTPPPPQVAFLQKRLAFTGILNVVILVGVLALMVVANTKIY